MSLEQRYTLNEFIDYAGSVGTRYSLEEGEKLYKQGDHARALFVVESGIVFSRMVSDSYRIVDTVSREGELIGYEAMNPETVFDGTAISATESKIIEVEKELIFPVFIAYPEAGEDLLRAVSGGIRQQEKLMDRFRDKATLETVLLAASELSSEGENPKVLVSQADQAARMGIQRQQLSTWRRSHPEIPTRAPVQSRSRK